jgi:hypothetical protein
LNVLICRIPRGRRAGSSSLFRCQVASRHVSATGNACGIG